jgi:site-specific recombinase XerD
VPLALRNRLSKIHVLTHGQIEQLFAVITDLRDRAIFLVAYRHGLRASEVSLLEKTDVDLAKTKITIRRLTRRPSAIHTLQEDEALALKRYLKSRADTSAILFLSASGGAITRRGLDWLMKEYGQQAQLPPQKRHFHVLKHSIATHLLAQGADLLFVHNWLGHTILQSTAIYAYLVVAERRSPRSE